MALVHKQLLYSRSMRSYNWKLEGDLLTKALSFQIITGLHKDVLTVWFLVLEECRLKRRGKWLKPWTLT
jgi:hypothetical protein